MIAARYRFHGHRSVRFVMARGQTRRGRMLYMRFVHNQQRTTPRCAVIVSKKIAKSAVKRNRVRRQIYNIVRHDIQHLEHAYDIIITVISPDAIIAPHESLKYELKKILATLAP